VHYRGVDLVTPDRPYNAGEYRRHALHALRESDGQGCDVIVVGGTGLYVKVLTHGLGRTWSQPDSAAPLVGLRRPTADLNSRIEARVRAMYREGFVDEVKTLRASYPELSRTARHAIGYAEAIALLEGHMEPGEAVERTVVRTRQLAKRQRTWFRHQARVEWVDVQPGMGVPDVAARVTELWSRYGQTRIAP
jgi:tRNA dimethylallyltransferase